MANNKKPILKSQNQSKTLSGSAKSFPGKVKIIGGKLKGRSIGVPNEGIALRPTSSRLKETLFNWLQFDIPMTHCLDLFAGSGSLGIEAYSRGAERVVLVEKTKAVYQQLSLTIKTIEASAIELICQGAIEFINTYNGPKFDVVFLDPPFEQAQDLILDALVNLDEKALLNENAKIYLEMPQDVSLTNHLNAHYTVLKETKVASVRGMLLQFSG